MKTALHQHTNPRPPCPQAGRAAQTRFWPLLSATLVAACLMSCSSGPSSNSPAASSNSTGKPNAGGGAATRSETNAVAASPKSLFRADPQSGRDPFFPGTRRVVTDVAGAAPVVQAPLVSQLKLVGIRPGTSRPMALINKTSLGLGEEGDVSIVVSNQLSRAEVQKVTVRCLEIRPDSVLISIAGELGVKELHLAQGK